MISSVLHACKMLIYRACENLYLTAISSSGTCYNETVNTLRFGHRAKQIVAQPLVNEDPKQKIIRDLKSEVQRLKELLSYYKVSS